MGKLAKRARRCSMRKATRPALNRARERRIEREIVVDAYTSDERALGWYYYLQGKMRFPYEAKCVAERTISPFKEGEKVEVLDIAPEDDCMSEVLVLVQFAGRKFGVPLAQFDPIRPDKATREAVEDWRYWVARGYEF